MATLPQKIGRKIREARKKQKFSQEELAEKSKVDVKTIIDLELGKRRNPTLKTIQRISKALNLNLSEVFPSI